MQIYNNNVELATLHPTVQPGECMWGEFLRQFIWQSDKCFPDVISLAYVAPMAESVFRGLLKPGIAFHQCYVSAFNFDGSQESTFDFPWPTAATHASDSGRLLVALSLLSSACGLGALRFFCTSSRAKSQVAQYSKRQTNKQTNERPLDIGCSCFLVAKFHRSTVEPSVQQTPS